MRHTPPAAFWRAWSSWVVSVAAYATASGYDTIHPLPAKLANDVGWLLSAVGLVFAAAGFGVFLVRFPRTLTLANWLGFLYLLGFGLCVFVVLLFPTGKLPSRRWRPVAWAAGVGLAGWALGNTFTPTIFTASAKIRNPVGLAGSAGDLFKAIAVAGVVLIAAAGLAATVSVAFRYRRAGTTERAQLKWLVYAAAVIVVAVLAQIPIASTNLQNAISIGAVALVPVAIGIAVLRYRLYDIDRVISRTVAYAIVTGLLVGIYAGLVLLATEVLGIHASVAVAAAPWPRSRPG